MTHSSPERVDCFVKHVINKTHIVLQFWFDGADDAELTQTDTRDFFPPLNLQGD